MFLHELPTRLALLAMVLATVGVLMLSLPPRGSCSRSRPGPANLRSTG
jgi:drug/metabolite transporter (DMT)-like permease